MKNKMKRYAPLTAFVLILVLSTSCVSNKKLKYFNDINEIQGPITNPILKKHIMPFDKLAIRVISSESNTNQLLGQINTGVSSSETSVSTGYLVDEEGNINFPFIGKVNLDGLTTDEAAAKLTKELNVYVTASSVYVQFSEKSVTLLGSVNAQGMYPFTQEKLTIYEAISLGGGISQYGDRDNVILIRQDGNKITQTKLNLTTSRIIGSEFYYILPNDIIVVEPLRSASWFNFNSSAYSLAITFLSSAVLIYSFFIRQ